MTDNKNTIIAIVLSALVLIAWQYFYAVPQAEKQKAAQQAQQQSQPAPAAPGQRTDAAPSQSDRNRIQSLITQGNPQVSGQRP